ncbi:hypothetical protein [Solirubrobacter soli]|uniref:hypothetical protein n=1 Tax=Solirubrobacter soli TaxID=363832 RepID=UPI00040C75A6|nr:hypothetical protein [Solirubrobacter soli]
MLEVHIAYPQDPLAEHARALEPTAFEDGYERASLFFVAVEDGRVVGMIRVIGDSPAGLKTLNEVGPVPGLDPFFTWDMASSVSEDAVVRHALYSAFLREGLRQGVYAAVAKIDGQAVVTRLRQVPAILAGDPPLYDRIVLGTGFARPVRFPARRELAPALR